MFASQTVFAAIVLAALQSAGPVFPTMTAPPEHAPMVINVGFQEQAEQMDETLVLGNIPNKASNADLTRTEWLTEGEVAQLRIAEDRHDVLGPTKMFIADKHGMGAVDGSKFHSWVVFRNGKIMQFEKRSK
jgi:hypothetical protein